MTERAVGVGYVQGQPQPRVCRCDRPVPLVEQERTVLGPTEPVERCVKCGHRTTT